MDLGLPSHTKWAAQNVGARKPSDAGLYFQWGDTVGYTADQVGKDKNFNWSDYKWYLSGDNLDNLTFTKYTTTGATLALEDDAAHVNMGGDWHMPTEDQINELINNTRREWTTQDGVNGILFTSKDDTSKSIFIPTAGFAKKGSIHNSGEYGYVWSSAQNSVIGATAQCLFFYSDDHYTQGNVRLHGYSVRGVING